VIDLSEQKQAESALREAERRNLDAQMQLAHANRIATMGQLAASIAHEVNQPIGATLVNAGTALRWLAASPPKLESVSQCLDRIVNDSKRGAVIIDRIRDLVKNTPAQKESLAINEVVLGVIELTSNEISDRRVSVQKRLTDGLPAILGDKVQLQQVVLNLIMNAVEAMSEIREGSRELLISSGRTEAGSVLVKISDSGPGLPSGNSERIFQAFYTTKTSGLGMGLSICRSIVEAHAGRLWAMPNEPHGAVFCMALPVGEQSLE
jgi:C4-dicarboxylate-specific signal transduction histidine kinase